MSGFSAAGTSTNQTTFYDKMLQDPIAWRKKRGA